MHRKAWVLFAATSVIWGSSFLLIRVAVAHMPPSLVVGRCLLGGRPGQARQDSSAAAAEDAERRRIGQRPPG